MCILFRCSVTAFYGEIKGGLSQQHPHVVAAVVAGHRSNERRPSMALPVDVTTRVDQQLQDGRSAIVGAVVHHYVPIGIGALGQ